jgi:hypothetical protein
MDKQIEQLEKVVELLERLKKLQDDIQEMRPKLPDYIQVIKSAPIIMPDNWSPSLNPWYPDNTAQPWSPPSYTVTCTMES